jgi:hypothetical protein
MAVWLGDAAAGFVLLIFIGCAFVLADVAPMVLGAL